MYYVSKGTGNYNWLLHKNASPADVSKKVEALESFNKVYRNSTANGDHQERVFIYIT